MPSSRASRSPPLGRRRHESGSRAQAVCHGTAPGGAFRPGQNGTLIRSAPESAAARHLCVMSRHQCRFALVTDNLANSRQAPAQCAARSRSPASAQRPDERSISFRRRRASAGSSGPNPGTPAGSLKSQAFSANPVPTTRGLPALSRVEPPWGGAAAAKAANCGLSCCGLSCCGLSWVSDRGSVCRTGFDAGASAAPGHKWVA